MILRKLVSSIGLILLSYFSFAQYKVTFLITGLPAYHKSSDTIYLEGSFNNWNPGDRKMQLKPIADKIGITIELPRGMFEYKFTKGSWNQVKTASEGKSIENRKLDVESDTMINVEIKNWADHFPKEPRHSTANKNVHILDTSFYIPQLNRHRRIWIYLPSSYTTSKKKYPVLYMHDGQNVFDEATSFSGEWGVDEALDSLGQKGKECIVVAIDHGGEKRINEYCPYDMEKYGKGEGNQYVDFLVHTLKPYVDKHFRTYKSKENTYIAGSSMGGLISFYAILKYPKVFGGAGVFSPAFWVAPQLIHDVEKKAKNVKGRIYFYAGKQEGESMVPDMLAIFQKMHQLSKAKMETVIRSEGRHTEANWRQEFPLFGTWILGD